VTLRDDLLPVFESARTLIHDLGLRRYDITVRTVSWDGGRPGLGNRVVTDTPLTLSTGARIKVRRLTTVNAQEIIASGGALQDGDVIVGPITPAYSGGGNAITSFLPEVTDPPSEVHYLVSGPDLDGGRWHKMVSYQADRNFGYYFTLRASNLTAP
jgi:hypothetical protein